MTLNIATFSNVTGGNALFKALTHPRVGEAARKLLDALRRGGPVAVFDPLGHAEAYANLYSFAEVDVLSVFVQRVEELSRTVLGREPQVVSAVACWQNGRKRCRPRAPASSSTACNSARASVSAHSPAACSCT